MTKLCLILFIFIIVLIVVIAVFNKLYSKTKSDLYDSEAENKKLKKEIELLKDTIKTISKAEENAKKDKEKINTDNPDDNFQHSLDILSEC